MCCRLRQWRVWWGEMEEGRKMRKRRRERGRWRRGGERGGEGGGGREEESGVDCKDDNADHYETGAQKGQVRGKQGLTGVDTLRPAASTISIMYSSLSMFSPTTWVDGNSSLGQCSLEIICPLCLPTSWQRATGSAGIILAKHQILYNMWWDGPGISKCGSVLV